MIRGRLSKILLAISQVSIKMTVQISAQGILQISLRSLPWSQRFFLIFLRLRWETSKAAIDVTILPVDITRLESHFHADARVRIWPSGFDWLIFLQTRKSMWLVHSIGNTKGTVEIFVIALFGINLASTGEANCVQNTSWRSVRLAVLFRSQFVLVQGSPVFDMDCVSESDVEEILISVLERRSYGTSEESIARGNKSPRTCSAYCQPDMENQLFSVAPRCLQISISVRLFI